MAIRARAAAAVAGLAVALSACATAEPAGQAPPLAEHVVIEQGELKGMTDTSGDDAVLRFRGIPFAAPPVDDLRWVPPQPPARWTGVREATASGPRCAQLPAAADVPHATAASSAEDCLYLDVTVPAGTRPGEDLPVIFWIHGGGFSAGAGSDYDPHRMVGRGDVIVVTANYRLGALGFLALPGLSGSGTFGLLDQQAALTWVQHNIAAFGGDPGNVTIAGESAGADSVCAHIASPSAAGLFAKAILHSSSGCGSANLFDITLPGVAGRGDIWKPLPLAQAMSIEVAAALGCAAKERRLTCLRNVPPDRLVALKGFHWSPATATPTLPRRPSDMIPYGNMRPVPILAGTTRDEGTLFVNAFFDQAGHPVTEATFRTLLSATTGSRASDARKAYRITDRAPGRAWADVVTDRAFACPALATYTALAKKAPVYAYEFADTTAPPTFAALPPDLADGVTHGAEIAYLLDLVPSQPALTPQQEALADEMIRLWTRFAHEGDPGPSWPRFVPGGELLAFTATGPRPLPAAEFAAAHHCRIWGQ